MSRYVSFGVLLVVIAVLSLLFYKILAGFLVPLFLAALLVVIFRPMHHWILEKVKGRQKTGAMLTTLAILLAVLIPFGTLTTLAVLEGKDAAEKFNQGNFIAKASQLQKSFGLYTPVAQQIRDIDSSFQIVRENWSYRDVESHQDQWYVIDQNSQQIEEFEDIDTSLKPSWDSFIAQKNAAEEIRNELVRAIELEKTTFQSPPPEVLDQLADYHELVNESASNFVAFKNQLLGGRTLANVRLLANPSQDQIADYGAMAANFFQSKLLSLGGATTAFAINLLLGTAIMVIALYFFLLDGHAMIVSFQGLSPLDDEHERELVDEFAKVSRAVVVATLLSALVQGLLAGIGYYFCGFESVILMMLLTMALALVPFFGAASVWVPAALFLFFFKENVPAAIGLAIYGAAVVSMADNFIKPIILHGQSNLHPLLALLSILGGVSTLGPIGLLVGPMVVAFLQTLLKILQREMSSMESDSAAGST